MATARFLEILRCHGVDQDATPHPGMVVPFGGENQVVLETAGMNLAFQRTPLKLQEFTDYQLTIDMLQEVKKGLSKPGTDRQQRDAFMPALDWQKPRFFRVLGTIKTGFPGTFLNVFQGGAEQPAARLRVAVVDAIVVKVAIRNVRARDAQGTMRYHAKQPCDPVKEVETMNAIWRPQTNIVFELVPSTDLDVDHNDPKTQEALRVAYGLTSPATFTAESTVWVDKNAGWFAQHRVPGTHMTLFVVHKLLSGGDPVYGRGGQIANGTMNRQSGVGFISDIRLPSTFAHEAGHFIGDMPHEGTDTKLLMRDGGSGYQIPFALAQRFRESVAKRKVV